LAAAEAMLTRRGLGIGEKANGDTRVWIDINRQRQQEGGFRVL